MRKAAHHSGGVVSLNPRHWRGERLHHHGGGVCWLFVLLWMDSEIIVRKKWYKNNPKEGLCGVTFWPTLACTTPVPTDVISPPEGASEEKSKESPVLPSNAPLRGKALQFQQYLEAKKQQEEQKKKKEKKQRKEEKKKRKRRNQREFTSNYFLLQRTGLDICKLKWPGNFSTMMFSPRTCATSFKMTLIHWNM